MRGIRRSEADARARGASAAAKSPGPGGAGCGEPGQTNRPGSASCGESGETNGPGSASCGESGERNGSIRTSCGANGPHCGSRSRSTGTDKEVTTWRHKPQDRGSGTLWMLALIGLIWSVATMAMAVGGVRAARHRAYAAADLAALAAASHLADGAGSACELAARIARGSGARLRQCVFHGRISDVVVVSEIRSIPALDHLTATARARAGPDRRPGS